MRDINEVLKEVRRIQLVASRQVNDLLAGEYQSVFKGRGMEFDSVREYVPGDEIRSIDWNVTARTSVPYVKKFSEERELTVLMAVDVSASGSFGSLRLSKMETAVEVAAVLMFSALKNHDKVGLLLFADDVVRYIPPRKGRSNVLRLIRDLLAAEPIKAPTNIANALEYISRVQRRRCVVFLMSDFMEANAATGAVVSPPLEGGLHSYKSRGRGKTWADAMAIANQRHDVVAVTLSDPRELSLPDVGFLTLRDAETDEVIEVDTHHPKVRELFAQNAGRRDAALGYSLRRAAVDRLDIRTDQAYALSLQKFFKMRESRQR